jgi:hypothetical protein
MYGVYRAITSDIDFSRMEREEPILYPWRGVAIAPSPGGTSPSAAARGVAPVVKDGIHDQYPGAVAAILREEAALAVTRHGRAAGGQTTSSVPRPRTELPMRAGSRPGSLRSRANSDGRVPSDHGSPE